VSDDTSAGWGAGPTRYFYELTPDIILSGIEALGYCPTGRVMPLNSMENRVFEVEVLPPGSDVESESERFRILKFYRPGRWSRDQIMDEHAFTTELVEEEIPVIQPEAVEGQTCFQLPESGIFYAAYPKAGGRNPDELNTAQLGQIGRLMARMHGVGDRRPALHRLTLEPEAYALSGLDYLLETEAIPDDLEDAYCDIVERLCEHCLPWFGQIHTLRLHGDAHLGNLLWSDRGPFWVDFDDMVTGPAIQDLWLLAPGRDKEARNQLQVLLKDYQWLRTFDRSELRLIEPLRAMRYIRFAAWMKKRWDDPAFPRAFPFFGTREYWQSQIEDLQECWEAMTESLP
jgi:Ser/Thr protein kinase RdoA (MazF antagonist)